MDVNGRRSDSSLEGNALNRSVLIRSAVTLVLATLAVAGRPPAVPAQGERSTVADVSIPNTRRLEFVSKVNGHRYSINVALPFEPAPERGYGVLYVIDGYSFFASATEATRDWNAANVVVVGIGYPTDSGFVNGALDAVARDLRA